MSFAPSIKTRLLALAHKAANKLAWAVYRAEMGSLTKCADSHRNDLFNYRDKVQAELSEGRELAAALSLANARAEEELKRVQAEIGFEAPTASFSLEDFDGRLTPVDEGEAPAGYKAVAQPITDGCIGCHFDPVVDCPGDNQACYAHERDDEQNVIFVKR